MYFIRYCIVHCLICICGVEEQVFSLLSTISVIEAMKNVLSRYGEMPTCVCKCVSLYTLFSSILHYLNIYKYTI